MVISQALNGYRELIRLKIGGIQQPASNSGMFGCSAFGFTSPGGGALLQETHTRYAHMIFLFPTTYKSKLLRMGFSSRQEV